MVQPTKKEIIRVMRFLISFILPSIVTKALDLLHPTTQASADDVIRVAKFVAGVLLPSVASKGLGVLVSTRKG